MTNQFAGSDDGQADGQIRVPEQLTKQVEELDDRFGAAGAVRTLLKKVFPDHWTFLLGEIALYSFIILIITGIFLSLFFKPSMSEIVYHGSYRPLDGLKMSEAYASTIHISFDVRGGLLMREIHHWAADVFLAAIMAHLLRIFFTGAYRKPRDTNWMIGVGMFAIATIEGFLGYSLPDDLLSGTGVRIAEGVLLSIPVVGTYLTFFLFGGQYPGTVFVERFYIIHVLLLPGLLLAMISAHLFIMVQQKHTQMPGKGRTDGNVVGQPMYPYFVLKTGAFFFAVFGVLTVLATAAQINPIWLYGPYNAAEISAGSQPDFYMGFLEGTLRMSPNWLSNIAGHTVAWNVLMPAVVTPGLFFTGLALWPAIERWCTGDKGYHHVNDRPRNAPTRTAVGAAGIAWYGVVLAEGGNDVIARFLHVPLYETTEVARYTIFIAPIVTFFVVRRICIGLQRRDGELLAHGVPSGVIVQLPNGEYREAEIPLTKEEIAVLASKRELPRLPAPGAVDENGVPVPLVRTPVGKVRHWVNELFAEGVALTPPTDGHGNGHGAGGANGHEAGAEPAAVGGGQDPTGRPLTVDRGDGGEQPSPPEGT